MRLVVYFCVVVHQLKYNIMCLELFKKQPVIMYNVSIYVTIIRYESHINVAEPSKMKQKCRLKEKPISRRIANKIVSNGGGVNYSILTGPFCPPWNWVIVTYPAIK